MGGDIGVIGYIIGILPIALLISYAYGYHRGEVDKHKEIFDLLDEGMKEINDRYWTIQGELIGDIGDIKSFLGSLRIEEV